MEESDVDRVMEVLEEIGADKQTNELTTLTAQEALAALGSLELPPWATDDAEKLVEFLASRLF